MNSDSSSPTQKQRPDIPDHDLIKVIGRGSYGEVWLARTTTGSYRAVKVVYRHTFEADKPYEREFTGIKEFEQISLSHPAQIDVLHVGRNDDEGYFYYVMELADDDSAESQTDTTNSVASQLPADTPRATTGSTIARVIHPETYEPRTLRSVLRKRGRLPVEECLHVALSLAEALEHLHSHGLVHRDIKPSNVIFVNGRPKLADIGLVARSDATLSFVGTEGYLPPEGPGKPQADVFSLGKVFYEMASGRDRNDFPQPPIGIEQTGDHEAFLEFNEIVLRACENSIERRYKTTTDLRHDLLVLETGRSVRRLHSFESQLSLFKRISAGFLALSVIAVAATIYQRVQTREKLELAEQKTEALEQAEAAVRRHELQQIEQMFETDKTSQALAFLAQRARVHTNDSFAAQRLLSALTSRNFALPVAELRHEAPGQQGRFTQIAAEDISPDNRMLATITLGGTLTLWDVRQAQRLFEARTRQPELDRGHYYLSVQFNRQGTHVVTPGGTESALRIWRVGPPCELALEIERPGDTGNFCHAEFSPDGIHVAAITQEGTGAIWNVETGEVLIAFDEELEGSVHHAICRFTPDGEHLINALAPYDHLNRTNRMVSLRNSRTGKLLTRRDDFEYASYQFLLWKDTVSLDPMETRLAYLRARGKVQVWDYLRNTVVTSDKTHKGSIRSIAFSPIGSLVASGGADATIRLWEVQAGELRLLREFDYDEEVISLAFSPDGSQLAAGSKSGTIRIWEVATGQPFGERLQHPSMPVHIEFIQNGRYLLSIPLFGASAWIWDVRSGAARPNLIVHHGEGDVPPGPVNSVKFSPDSAQLVSSLGGSRWQKLSSQVWDSATSESISAPIEKFESNTSVGPVTKFAVTPDGSRALTALERSFTLWDPRDGMVLLREQSLEHDPDLLALSPNGRWALIGKLQGEAAVWDLENQKKLWSTWPDGLALAASFSPDSSRVFVVTISRTSDGGIGVGTVRMSESGEKLLSFDNVPWARPDWYPPQAHWNPDQRLLAYAQRWSCHFYDAETGEAIADGVIKHNGVIRSSGFSGDGRYFLTAAADKTARIWDLESWKQAAPELRHEDGVEAAVFSRDSLDVTTASLDRTARLWDRETGLPLTERFWHPEWVLAVDIDSTGRWLATGCQDGVARIWELPRAEGPVPDWLLDLAEWMGGLELTPGESLDRVVDPGAILALKEHLNSNSVDAKDEYVRWGRWFFADRDTRSVSPSAEVGMEVYEEQLMQLEGIRR